MTEKIVRLHKPRTAFAARIQIRMTFVSGGTELNTTLRFGPFESRTEASSWGASFMGGIANLAYVIDHDPNELQYSQLLIQVDDKTVRFPYRFEVIKGETIEYLISDKPADSTELSPNIIEPGNVFYLASMLPQLLECHLSREIQLCEYYPAEDDSVS